VRILIATPTVAGMRGRRWCARGRAVYDGVQVSEQRLVEQVAAIFEKHREEALERGGQSSEAHVAMAQAAEEAVKLLAAELDRLRAERT